MNEKHILLFVLSVIIYVKHMSKLESTLYWLGYVTVSMQCFDWPRGAEMERGGAEAFDKAVTLPFRFLNNHKWLNPPVTTAAGTLRLSRPGAPNSRLPITTNTFAAARTRWRERGWKKSFQNKTSKTHRGTEARAVSNVFPLCLKIKHDVLIIFVFICLSVSR